MIDKSSLYKILGDNNSLVENLENNFGNTYDGGSLLSFVFLMFKKLESKIDGLDTKFNNKLNDLDKKFNKKFQLLERKITLTHELQIKSELKERLETEFNIKIRKMDSVLFRSTRIDKRLIAGFKSVSNLDGTDFDKLRKSIQSSNKLTPNIKSIQINYWIECQTGVGIMGKNYLRFME
jgi:hypothetical protein